MVLMVFRLNGKIPIDIKFASVTQAQVVDVQRALPGVLDVVGGNRIMPGFGDFN